MKKLIKTCLLSLVSCFFLFGAASAVELRLYYSPACPFCHHAKEFINNELIVEFPHINIVGIDVSTGDQRALNQFRATLRDCNFDSGGVPVMVIGGECFQGYSPMMNDDLRNAVINAPTQKKTTNPLIFIVLLAMIVSVIGFFVLRKKKA